MGIGFIKLWNQKHMKICYKKIQEQLEKSFPLLKKE